MSVLSEAEQGNYSTKDRMGRDGGLERRNKPFPGNRICFGWLFHLASHPLPPLHWKKLIINAAPAVIPVILALSLPLSLPFDWWERLVRPGHAGERVWVPTAKGPEGIVAQRESHQCEHGGWRDGVRINFEEACLLRQADKMGQQSQRHLDPEATSVSLENNC